MHPRTLNSLRCPSTFRKKSCGSRLALPQATGEDDLLTGTIQCSQCGAKYPILKGIAVVVPDVRTYLLHHAKGIGKIVPDSEIPREYREDFVEAREAAEEEAEQHIEEDLEAERVNALYFMNHYLSVDSEPQRWWAPAASEGSPEIDALVKRHWDSGPFAQIRDWSASLVKTHPRWVELGCGVGGLARILFRSAHAPAEYLGVDSSFASIALARHLHLGAPYSGDVRIPEDLLVGGVSRKINLSQLGLKPRRDGSIDFVVGEVERAPLAQSGWDVSVSLNLIDMLEEPWILPQLQHTLVRSGGVAIQSGPYIWHPDVARRLRKRLGGKVQDSAEAVKELYEAEGLTVREERRHVPWLFFKHVRQLELYSVHLLQAISSK